MKHFYTSYGFFQLMHARLAAFVLALCASIGAWSQSVSYEQAEIIASDFFKSHGVASDAAVPKHVRRHRAAAGNANSPYYIFNNAESTAFVVVSGDSRLQQVLAYSTDGAFDEDNIAPGAAFMLGMYEDYLNSINDAADVLAPAKVIDDGTGGKRLGTATWNQSGNFWWNKCPEIDGKNTYAGCVAAAMAILMRHYGWAQGSGSKTYTWNETELTANFGATDYNISDLPTGNQDDAAWTDERKERVATLLYHCGVAANMNYGTESSGTTVEAASVGLWHYFGYTLGYALPLNSVGSDGWIETVKAEIDAGRPMIYDGTDKDGYGHAFICEGYDNSNRLYFNFGWSGSGNGYYAYIGVTYLQYYQGQKMLLGIRPYTDSAPKELYDIRLPYTNGMPEQTGIALVGSSIQRCKEFYVNGWQMMNVSDKVLTVCWMTIGLHKAASSTDVIVGGMLSMPDFAPNSWLTGGVSFPCKLPYDYTFDENDYLFMCYSTDGGSTWKKVPCYDPQYETIPLKDIYDPTEPLHFKMCNGSGDIGTQLYDCGGYDYVIYEGVNCWPFNVEGRTFGIKCNNIFNQLPVSFVGDVAVFLCDKDGNRKLQLGSGNTYDGGKAIQSNSGYTSTVVFASISPGTEIVKGDRMYLYSRYKGKEEWVRVECETAGKEYVEMPEEYIPTTKALAFSNEYATLCSRYNLDFSAASDVYAYKASGKAGNSILLERVTQVKAGEGVLLRGMNLSEGVYKQTLDIIDDSPALGDNLFVGVLENTNVTQDRADYDNYVLGSLNGAVGFYLANGVTLEGGKAYLSVPSSLGGGAKMFSVSFSDDGQDGIISVDADGAGSADVYNLQGIKVDTPNKGLYIINGRKVLFNR